jgi:Fe-S cluster assembly protein SufD
MARGIPADEAERLVVRGYFADVLDRVPLETTREWLLSLVDAEIGDGGGLEAIEAAP